ncbi:MAG: hypothetical protein NW237_17495 [Cyanobacteriota bacterium]|nr:hypothetical protein [Cyanobacteriota bacterium]
MVGILRRLFNRPQKEQKAEPMADPQPKTKDPKAAFFLAPDEAKSLGNIDYMRTPRLIKRTFVSLGTKEEFEVVQQVSALEAIVLSEESAPATPEGSPVVSQTNSPSVSPQRRSTSSDLDKFRTMARDLKKKT